MKVDSLQRNDNESHSGKTILQLTQTCLKVILDNQGIMR